jgi:uncharacterized protein YbjT (DUF2867 family)
MTTVLVTGATGNVGRPLVTLLADAGAKVRAVTRRPDVVTFPVGVDVVTSASAGIGGADAVFLNSRALGDDLATVVKEARSAGVTRLVALSAINADDDFSLQPSRFRGDRNKEVEQLAADSGLEWVSLRPAMFASNVAGMWSAQLQAGDVVRGPYASASMAPIVERDIAAVAAQALLTDHLNGRKIALTGPHTFTNAELVDVIGAVLDRPFRYTRFRPRSCGSNSSDWAFRLPSPMPTSPIWPRPWTSQPKSPMRWKRSWAVRRSRSRTGLPTIAPYSPTNKEVKP